MKRLIVLIAVFVCLIGYTGLSQQCNPQNTTASFGVIDNSNVDEDTTLIGSHGPHQNRVIEVDFTVPNASLVGSIHIELLDKVTSTLILQSTRSMAEIQERGEVSGQNFSMALPAMPSTESYTIKLVVESVGGVRSAEAIINL